MIIKEENNFTIVRESQNQMNQGSDNVPELRFPEFVNDREWELEELEQCLAYLQPTAYLVGSTDYKDEYETPVLTAGKSFILGYTNEKEGVFNENLPVIIFDDFTTASQFVDFPFKTKSSAMKILLAKNGNNIKFVYESMQTLNYEVGVHKRHWISAFSKLKISIPNNTQEQQNIASCLSSLDEVIAAHSQKFEALKEHKKGLMQSLFPQEGETVPAYRFPEFENDGEWVEKKLGDNDISTFVNQKISVQKLKQSSYISTENMLPDFAGISVSSRLPQTGNFTKFIEGDILISNIRPYLKKVWKSNLEGGASNDVLVLRAGSNLSNEFLEYILKNDAFINYVMKSAKGVKMPRGDKSSMQEYPIMIPSINEQQKIASCLSSLDESVSAQAEKIEQLKLHKKGLMQGLFPKMAGL